MKPTTIRNRTIYSQSATIRSKLLSGHLSKDLKQKYHKRSVRITEGDTVKVLRGEFKGVSGKVTKVSTEKNGVAVEGIKKEKLKGGNLDVFVHTSNLVVTDLNTEDKWRAAKLEGKSLNSQKVKTKKAKTELKKQSKDTKESKASKSAKKENK